MFSSNRKEAQGAVQLLKYFKQTYPLEFLDVKIGIITPYQGQVDVLRTCFTREFGSKEVEEMQISTVDAFQGREVDILLLSTVRASTSGSISFLSDVRRMNVALTRPKLREL
ncbi:hypothetical protein F2Q70_00043013 [Brassica cretica]|uniref:DNA2/NAM7 helicase-like C-terminal domain-containing protein n=1 Tax=Brassica cretica TaxID=69181 RepID=A0A8S9KHA0_BRACR|nr:hypothetical protein F2Q70_00043013 [Brassica cretica]